MAIDSASTQGHMFSWINMCLYAYFALLTLIVYSMVNEHKTDISKFNEWKYRQYIEYLPPRPTNIVPSPALCKYH